MKREYEYRVHVVVEHGVEDSYVTDADGNLPANWPSLDGFEQMALRDYHERQQAADEDAADAKLEARREREL